MPSTMTTSAIDGHPSVVLVPAVLAEGERLGASGEEMIAAYVAGYEVPGPNYRLAR